MLKGIPQGSGLGLFLFNVFMNNILYFMEIYDLLNYADDNTLSIIRNTVNLVISALRKDAENAMLWFRENFMQASPRKFQFMIMQKYTSQEIISVLITKHGTTIMRPTEVKLLGITIDQNLNLTSILTIYVKILQGKLIYCIDLNVYLI